MKRKVLTLGIIAIFATLLLVADMPSASLVWSLTAIRLWVAS